MKKFKNLSWLFFGLLMISCQTESIETNEEIDPNLVQEVTNIRMTEAEEFENRMQWASYVSAKLLAASTAHQNLFTSELGLGDTIPLGDILGNPLTAFHQDFRGYFIWYFGLEGNFPEPDQNPNRPPPPPPLGGGFGEITPEEEADYMIDYLVNQNCVELFFPVGLQFSGFTTFTLTSTAHPLNEDSHNDGVKRFSTLRYTPAYPSGVYTQAVNVNDLYISVPSAQNIIVTRPYRSPLICPYSEYGELDFEDFLD